MSATGPLDFALTAVRTREITKRSRAVVNLERKCARLRRQLDEAQDELIKARRFLRGVIADTVELARAPMQDGGPLPGETTRCPIGRCFLDAGHECQHMESAEQ